MEPENYYFETSGRWFVRRCLGRGGYGKVYKAYQVRNELVFQSAVKVVPKTARGAARELELATDLGDARNIVHIEEIGEDDSNYLLRMPCADYSLRDCLKERGRLAGAEAVPILCDLATALVDVGKVIVHRDIKPENILFLSESATSPGGPMPQNMAFVRSLQRPGAWCLADFGISRYAEADTSQETFKHAGTYPYCPPEWWKNQRYTQAGDVYALGVVAYEMISGRHPFLGPEPHDLHDQHLTDTPPPLIGVNPILADLIETMLVKPAGARPSAHRVVERLEQVVASTRASPGVAKLRNAGLIVTRKKVVEHAAANAAAQVMEHREDLWAEGAVPQLEKIIEMFRSTVSTASDHIEAEAGLLAQNFALNGAQLQIQLHHRFYEIPTDLAMPFEVIATAFVGVSSPAGDRSGWRGRRHSLWYCDAKYKGEFGWYETAFGPAPHLRDVSEFLPWHRSVDLNAVQALTITGPEICAWPFTEISASGTDEFIDRWVGWFADASTGDLIRPMNYPDRDPSDSWRILGEPAGR